MNRVGRPRLAQLLAQFLLPQQTRDASERAQVLRAGVSGGQEREDQVHRRAINGVEIDRRLEAQEDGAHAVEPAKPRVRHGHAGADPGRTHLFTGQQGIEHFAGVETEPPGGGFSQERQRLMFGVGGKLRRDGAPVQQVFDGDQDALTWPLESAVFARRPRLF
jgi:hypothetical protein